jgi:hypothetical protein
MFIDRFFLIFGGALFGIEAEKEVPNFALFWKNTDRSSDVTGPIFPSTPGRSVRIQ